VRQLGVKITGVQSGAPLLLHESMQSNAATTEYVWAISTRVLVSNHKPAKRHPQWGQPL